MNGSEMCIHLVSFMDTSICPGDKLRPRFNRWSVTVCDGL